MISMNKMKNKSQDEKQKAFLKNAKEIHGNKYDYSKAIYKNDKEKMEIICPIHGSFFQCYNIHIIAERNCPLCASKNRINANLKTRDKAKIRFFKNVKEIYGDIYDFSEFDYVNNKTKGKIICKKHGEFYKEPIKLVGRKQGCPLCSKEQTLSNGEYIIEKILKDTELTILRNKENCKFGCRNIRPLDFDFFIEEMKLFIEFDGSQHFYDKYNNKDEFQRVKKCDSIRNKWVKANSYSLIRISYRFSDEDIKEIINLIINKKFKSLIYKYNIFLIYKGKQHKLSEDYYKSSTTSRNQVYSSSLD